MDLIESLDSLNIDSAKPNRSTDITLIESQVETPFEQEKKQKVVISIGSDCCVAYNIRKLNYANVAFPFDWMKLDSMKSLISIINSDFAGFCDIDQYDILPQHANFMYNENEEEYVDLVNLRETPFKLSNFKMVHKKYKFILPHEYDGDNLDIEKFKEKYTRRIKRFRQYVKDPTIETKFIRLGSYKDKKHIDSLTDVIDEYCKHDNFAIYYLNESIYELPKMENFIWTREHIPWKTILNL
jgi:hypothetical protein